MRISRENQTMPLRRCIRPARKMLTIAPTPGAAMFIPARPVAEEHDWFPIASVVFPVACMIPMQS